RRCVRGSGEADAPLEERRGYRTRDRIVVVGAAVRRYRHFGEVALLDQSFQADREDPYLTVVARKRRLDASKVLFHVDLAEPTLEFLSRRRGEILGKRGRQPLAGDLELVGAFRQPCHQAGKVARAAGDLRRPEEELSAAHQIVFAVPAVV